MKYVMHLFDTIHGSIPYTCPLIYLDILSKVKESVGTMNDSVNISIFCDSELGGLPRNPGGTISGLAWSMPSKILTGMA